ncbi:hypothetical protein B0H19DRAFT_1031184 [Mycena capillaripes]|nr:hypothetical protein B0H19DRAFT_1031184 [Mycena capillaripes]
MNARIQILKQVLTRKWFNDQRTPLELAPGDLSGKTVIVTGSNRGVGFEAAKHFAEMNVGRLILACRNVDAGDLAAKQIVEATGCSTVTCWPLDLGSFASVREFANRIDEGKIHVDILVGNAAIMSSKFTTTEDKWETMLEVNYLSNALLTLLLLPNLSVTSKPRVILLSSEAHYFISQLAEANDGPLILSKLNDRQHCSKQSVMDQRYFVSKLFILFFARELARRVDSDTGPTVVSVSPGLCSSDLDIESTAPTMRPLKRIVMSFISRTLEMGSRTIVHAAVSDDDQVQHGRYLANCRAEKESEFSLGQDGMIAQSRLWDETMQILKIIDPRVETILQSL